jgi:hypothetical protein
VFAEIGVGLVVCAALQVLFTGVWVSTANHVASSAVLAGWDRLGQVTARRKTLRWGLRAVLVGGVAFWGVRRLRRP